MDHGEKFVPAEEIVLSIRESESLPTVVVHNAVVFVVVGIKESKHNAARRQSFHLTAHKIIVRLSNWPVVPVMHFDFAWRLVSVCLTLQVLNLIYIRDRPPLASCTP